MSSRFVTRVVRCLVCAALLAGSGTLVPATITDDINPLDHLVVVDLSNPDAEPAIGAVTVTSIVGGRIATSSASFRIAPGGRSKVSVAFAGRVAQVVEVSITEGPDPIPQ